MNKASYSEKETARVTIRRGFGFAEFSSVEVASTVLAALKADSISICDKRLIAEFSKASSTAVFGKTPAVTEQTVATGPTVSDTSSKNPDNILVVKNLSFEATKSDVLKLVSAYGSVVRVRLPVKTSVSNDGRKQHRGFAFVKLATRSDLQKAMKGLSGVHLYGRRLVLEETTIGDDEQAMMDSALKRASLRKIVMAEDRANVNTFGVKGSTKGKNSNSVDDGGFSGDF